VRLDPKKLELTETSVYKLRQIICLQLATGGAMHTNRYFCPSEYW